MTLPWNPATGARSRLERDLRATQDDHDSQRRSTVEGVTASALDADNARWEAIGSAIAELAELVHAGCAASETCDSRPPIDALAIRLSEALDDQVDEPAWRVIDAAARWRASSMITRWRASS